MGLISRVSSRTYRNNQKMAKETKVEENQMDTSEQTQEEPKKDPEQEKLEKIQKLAQSERDHMAAKQSTPLTLAELQTLPARQYLDNTVLPLLQAGMEQLVAERPPNPVDWMATFMLKNKALAPYASK